ncbi:MAG: ribonuclease R, partial [Pseudomonadota bacterium]
QETFDILEQLRDAGKVQQLSKHRWAMKHAVQEHNGKVVGHVDGHGYVLTDTTKEKVFLRSHEMREVLHNDRVKVRVNGRDRKQRLFGQIIEILERGNERIVGRYYRESGLNFVVPDDQRIGQDIFVLPEHVLNAEEGQVVLAKITKAPSKHFQPVGEIVEVLGDYMAPGMEIEIAKRKHQIPIEWPSAVIKQVGAISDSVAEADKAGRVDLRHLALVTIDGEDARDFDDAVYCEPNKDGGLTLWVAIADVSHYVVPDSPLDQEAWQRGTSVYFPSEVIPMLPEKLSNGLCSLNPHVDRLCFTCEMQIDAQGEIVSYDFVQAVMHSKARLTYTQVAAYMGGEALDVPAEVITSLNHLITVSDLLGKRRRVNGAVEFDLPEAQIIFDDQRKISQVVARERNDAHKLIEECMLAANICAALILDESELVGMFRVHEQPEPEKIEDVRLFLRQFKLLLEGGEAPQPKHFKSIIDAVDDPLVSKVVQSALLRSMKQARYSCENDGHFALDFDSYTHFTSPIRRYPDLVVHRQIKRLIKDLNAQDDSEMQLALEQTADQASVTERHAEAASREVIQWLKCEYMSQKIGEDLPGIVTTVTDFGMFVELEEHYIEGLVHITALGADYYRFDQSRRRLIGEKSGVEYKAGQRVQVKVSRVDLQQQRIDFDLTDVARSDKGKRPRPSKHGKNKSRRA